MGGRYRKLHVLQQKIGEEKEEMVETFFEEESVVRADDISLPHPVEEDVQDELSTLEGFRDFTEESRGNNLSYGDY